MSVIYFKDYINFLECGIDLFKDSIDSLEDSIDFLKGSNDFLKDSTTLLFDMDAERERERVSDVEMRISAVSV